MKQVAINVPGSKSITNRILILASLSNKTTTIKNAAICDDSLYMIKGLKKLGIKISRKGTTIKVKGNGGKFPKQAKTIKINAGNAGTAVRFLTAFATLTGNKVIIDGSKRMRQRPIHELTKALNSLGAKVEDTNGFPPITIYPQKPLGGKISIKGNISSQYISAILMIAPWLKKGVKLNIEQETYSKPYIALTRTILGQSYSIVEPDASSASYIGAFTALHPQIQIKLTNVHKNSIQGDIKFLDYLKKMGCKIKESTKGITIQGPKELKSLGKIDMNETPDLVMTFAALTIFTKGKTLISNIANLRIKETDRLRALKTEISKLGITVKTTKDSIEIIGNPNLKITKPITIKTYDDHRIAMAFGVINSRLKKLKIQNPGCVSKSYPTFWKDLNKLDKALPTNLVLIGLRGSGKSMLCKMLSKRLNKPLIDIDREIEKEERLTVREIYDNHGWKYFRKLEKAVVKKLVKTRDSIISTGGGTVIYTANSRILKENGIFIYLHRNPLDCAKMLQHQDTRPPLTKAKSPLEEIKMLYKSRHPIYSKLADITIERTNDLKKDAKKIIELLP